MSGFSKNFVVFSIVFFGIGSQALAFDAGTSDPDLRQADTALPGVPGGTCRTDVGFLQRSGNITQLAIVHASSGREYQYNGAI